MNNHELRKYISDYEQYKNIYMNFSVDEKGVWGLPEGDNTQHLLKDEKLNNYKEFLNNAIKYYEMMSNFFNNDYNITKKLDKYRSYLKRLTSAEKKLLTVS